MAGTLGREILADVLLAASEVLRRNRQISAQLASGVEDAAEAGGNAALAAARTGSDMASGAAEAGADFANAASVMAQTAAGALARMATEAARGMRPGVEAESSRKGGRSRRRHT
jgi:hypothetical protein